MKRSLFVASSLAAIGFPAGLSAKPSDFGVVLMHGKWSTPDAYRDVTPALHAAG